MTDSGSDAQNQASAQAPTQRFRHSRRLGWVRSLLLNLALIAVPILIYFAIAVKHAASYADERSLRALQEVATQVDNRLETMKSILGFAPGQIQALFTPHAKQSGSGKSNSIDDEDVIRLNRQEIREMIRLMPKVPGVGLSFIAKCADSRACTSATGNEIDFVCRDAAGNEPSYSMIVGDGPSPEIRMVDCVFHSNVGVTGRGTDVEARGVVTTTIPQMIENTQSLEEMPMIMVASASGDVYAQLSRNRTRDMIPPAQQEVREEPTLLNLRELLLAADKFVVSDLEKKNALAGTGDNKGAVTVVSACCDRQTGTGSSDPVSLALPVALDTRIAGVPYRAYILPYTLKDPVCKRSDIERRGVVDKSKCLASNATLYFVGLRPGGALANAGASFSPGMLLGALFLVSIACLLLPFLRYTLLEPNDAVPWWQVRMISMAILGLSLIGVIAARSSELSYSMYAKMDAALGVVAEQIDNKLKSRIKSEFGTLESLENEASKDWNAIGCGDLASSSRVPATTQAIYPSVESFFQTDETGHIKVGSRSYEVQKGSWVTVCRDGDVHLRPYFSLLKKGRGVIVPGVSARPIILQRLFNKPDGKKVLQMATATSPDQRKFSGISSVNIGAIETINPVLPLEIGYAIFERSTGTVVFHSDDSRSLVENFYAETERDPTLASAAMEDISAGIRFEGRYRGADTTILYRPMSYSPWGLAVYYKTASVSAITLLAVVNAIAVTLIVLFLGLVLAHAITLCVCRHRSWLWPQWRLRNAYIAVTVYLAVVALCEFPILRDSTGGPWQAVVFLTGPLFVVTSCISTLSARTAEITIRRPLLRPFGLSLLHGCMVMHALLCIIWVCAAWVAGHWLSGAGLVVSYLAWIVVLWTAKRETKNPNAWRHGLAIWPAKLTTSTGRASYRMRYVTFAMMVSVAVSAIPALAIFDRTFEWYLSSAVALARSSTNQQETIREQKISEDMRNLNKRDSAALREARDSWSFGVRRVKGVGLDADGRALFGAEESVVCRSPPVALPLSVLGTQFTFGNIFLERLGQAAMALEKPGNVRQELVPEGGKCGINGTIHYVLKSRYAVPVALCEAFFAVAIVASLMLLLNFLAQRAMGIAWPWSGRSGRQRAICSVGDPNHHDDENVASRHVLMLQSEARTLDGLRNVLESPFLEVDLAADDIKVLMRRGVEYESLLLLRLEVAILDEKRRMQILAFLEGRVAHSRGRVVLASDVSPVYRIARPHAYPGPVWPHISDNERLRWIDLFTNFRKTYSIEELCAPPSDAIPAGDAHSTQDGLLQEFICREARALWPCLKSTRDELLARARAGEPITDRQVVELFALHGEVHYRRAWEYCTREERLALYHLANGRLINMTNHRVLEHLLRRGMIVFEPQPRIKSASLAEFILNAELPGRMEAWAAEAAEGVWQSLRAPLFIVLMLSVAWIAYISGDAFKAVLAVLTTSVAVVGQALRLLGVAGLPGATKDK